MPLNAKTVEWRGISLHNRRHGAERIASDSTTGAAATITSIASGETNVLKKIAVLDDMIQGQLLESILKDQSIPHVIRTYHDSAYDGLFRGQQGWGHVEAPEEYESEILKLLADLRTQDQGT